MWKLLLITFMAFITISCSTDHREENETFLKAQSCRQQGSPEKAENMATNYLHQYPDDPDMKLLLASIYFQKKEYAKARELLEPAVKQFPNYTDLSVLLTRVNEAEAAANAAPGTTTEKANDDNILNNKDAVLNKVRLLQSDGDYASAKNLAWKYLKNHPFDIDMQAVLLSIYYGKAKRTVQRPKYQCE